MRTIHISLTSFVVGFGGQHWYAKLYMSDGDTVQVERKLTRTTASQLNKLDDDHGRSSSRYKVGDTTERFDDRQSAINAAYALAKSYDDVDLILLGKQSNIIPKAVVWCSDARAFQRLKAIADRQEEIYRLSDHRRGYIDPWKCGYGDELERLYTQWGEEISKLTQSKGETGA